MIINDNKESMLKLVLYICILSLFLSSAYAAPPSPPAEYEVEIKSQTAATISNENPDENYNIGIDKMYLAVGLDEFCYKRWALIRFDPIIMPTYTEIIDAKIKLYKGTDNQCDVAIYALQNRQFNEEDVTWNNMPFPGVRPVSIQNLSGPKGWYYLDLPTWVVLGWESSPEANYGIAIAPNWQECGKSITFRSDEYSSYSPTLIISYRGESPPSSTTSPPQPPDTTPCEVTYSVTPQKPHVGDLVTLTATATDNQAMSYIIIQKGSVELARQDARTSNQRELRVSYTQEATLPKLHFDIWAGDIGDSPPQYLNVVVPVTGTGTLPEVTVTADWVDENGVVQERDRLINGDGQKIRITATASDPDGIRYLYITTRTGPNDNYYNDEISVSEQIEWINDAPSGSRFFYSASAQDAEGNYVTASGESFEIFPPGNCYDGIMNQGEEYIDCGGPCEIPCTTYDPCSIEPMPVRFDWRNYRGGNYITPVQNQVNCGGCWAYASIAAVESRYIIEQGDPRVKRNTTNLSEQYLISGCCDAGDCNGGNYKKALKFIRDEGVPDEQCVPEEWRDSSCRPCGDFEDRLWKVNDYDWIHGSNTIERAKRAILCHGPLVTCFSYDWGHCAAIIGYDTDSGICREAYGQDSCWILKNSWGDKNGMEETDVHDRWSESAAVYFEEGFMYIPFEGHDYSREMVNDIRYIGNVQSPA